MNFRHWWDSMWSRTATGTGTGPNDVLHLSSEPAGDRVRLVVDAHMDGMMIGPVTLTKVHLAALIPPSQARMIAAGLLNAADEVDGI